MDIKQINHYEAFHKLGESATSVIYKAYDSEKQIQVSVKQLKPSDSIKRNIHKLKSYIGLEHPNLCTVHAVEEYEDSIIVVSDYVEGTPLQKLLIKPDYQVDSFIELLIQISDGLSVLHEKNLPHGNLKPSNIIIDQNGQAILTDIGLSPFEDFQNSPEFIAPYEAYHYLSPEQINNETVNCQSDFFAIGIIAYRIIFGKLPFEGKNEDGLIKSILEYYPDFSHSGLHNKIHSLLLGKLLAKNSQDRFANLTELTATLNEIRLYEQNGNQYMNSMLAPSNPRKYLGISLLAVLMVVLWYVLSRNN